MFKVINRKMYNTQKSNKVLWISLYDITTDTDTHKEILYKTKKWDYILYSYVDNIYSAWEKIWENLMLLNIMDIIDWYAKRQNDFLPEDKEKFLKEFWKYILEW